MNDREAYEFYADPANREAAGPPRKRKGQRLASMTSVRFAPEVIEAVKDRAFGEGFTVGSWIRRLVQRELDSLRSRPSGLIEGSGRAGEPRALGSSLVQQPRTFTCPHLSVSNVTWASCGTCGPIGVAA